MSSKWNKDRRSDSASELTEGNLALDIKRLRTERETLLDELERAYEGLAQALEISRREADAAYGELRNKIAILERKVFELISLNNIGKAITSVLSLEEVLEVILARICELIDVDAAVLALANDRGQLEITHVRGLPRSLIGKGFPLEVEVAYRTALGKNEPLVIADLECNKGLSLFKLDPRMRSAVAVPLKTSKQEVGVLVLNSAESHSFTEDNVLLLSTFGAQAAVAIVNAKLYQDLKTTLVGVIASLSAALEAKDPYTEGHSARVAEYAVAIGQELGLQGAALEELRNAGLIHDIGKIGVPESIISKKGRLTGDEMGEMKLHPIHGENIASPIPFLQSVVAGVKSHHERFDGKGYPEGLSRERIPLIARVLAVADAFDAMTSRRPYREPGSPEEALREIKANSGTQFDPEVVNAFERAFERIVAAGGGRWQHSARRGPRGRRSRRRNKSNGRESENKGVAVSLKS